MKPISTTDIITKYNNLSAPKKVLVLYGALDYMEQYNGRSKTRCLCLSMGYIESPDGWIKK